MSLTYHRNLGGSIWLSQLIYGFKLTRILSLQHAFPPSDKALQKNPNRESLSRIPTHPGSRNVRPNRDTRTHRFYGEMLWKIRRTGGFPKLPPTASTGAPLTLQNHKLNVSLRFGVERSGNLRACGDFRYAMTNLACCVAAPIKLSSWGHLEEMCRSVGVLRRDWRFFKADHGAAYKQLPLEAEQSHMEVISLR